MNLRFSTAVASPPINHTLYAACSGNPTVGKIKEIANALNVHYIELLEEKRDLEFFIKYKGETKRITENDLIEIFDKK